MHVVMPAAWVWQIRPGAQLIIGVKVGIQVEPIEAPLVDVMHEVVDICEVVRHTRGPVVELVGEEVVEVIVVGGVLEAELEAALEVVKEGESVEEGVSVVDGAALEGESVDKGVSEGESEVDGADAVVCASLVLESAAVVLASVTSEAAEVEPFFCLFLKSPNVSSLGGMAGNPQKLRIALEVKSASTSEQPPVTRHCPKVLMQKVPDST